MALATSRPKGVREATTLHVVVRNTARTRSLTRTRAKRDSLMALYNPEKHGMIIVLHQLEIGRMLG